METFEGKVAVITGAASGIGFALAQRLAAEGMSLALADYNRDALAAARARLALADSEVMTECVDVGDSDAMERFADAVHARFGSVHLLCNNAGILRPGRTWEQTAADWATILNINVIGVVNGLRSFVPAMLAHGEECYVVNTASAAGLVATPHMAAYTASKHAVVAITETLAAEVALLPHARMGVAVLCPGIARTNIYRSEVDRQAVEAAALSSETARVFEVLSSPDRDGQYSADEVAQRTIEGIRRNELHILLIQPHVKEMLSARLEGIAHAAGLR